MTDIGISAEGIRLMLDIEDVPKHKWFDMTYRIINYITEYRKAEDAPKQSPDINRS